MRFHLNELIALPLLFVAISVAISLFKSDGFLYAPRAEWMVAELEELTALANGELADHAELSSTQKINDMIADPNSEFDDLFGQHLRLDHWGNSYVCVENDTSHEGRWQFFSKGRDRVSHTNGSDLDDLNSWDLSHDYYAKLDRSISRRDIYGKAVIWALPAFVLFICFKRYWQRRADSMRV